VSKYFVQRPQTTDWYQFEPDLYQKTDMPPLSIQDTGPINTGLVDEDGNPILSRARDKIGFLRP
jgi:hypothetical protein